MCKRRFVSWCKLTERARPSARQTNSLQGHHQS
nr:MAG TPA: hypothetical protein [Caudoviricetes sp.]